MQARFLIEPPSMQAQGQRCAPDRAQGAVAAPTSNPKFDQFLEDWATAGRRRISVQIRFLSWLQPTQERGRLLSVGETASSATAAPGSASVDRLRQIVPLLPLSRHHRVPRPYMDPTCQLAARPCRSHGSACS